MQGSAERVLNVRPWIKKVVKITPAGRLRGGHSRAAIDSIELIRSGLLALEHQRLCVW